MFKVLLSAFDPEILVINKSLLLKVLYVFNVISEFKLAAFELLLLLYFDMFEV